MKSFELTLPAMGEGIIEATVTRWFVEEGDFIKEDEPLLEVATDKVDSEIPAPVSGKIVRIIYHEGEIPKVGEVLAVIETEGSVEESKPAGPEKEQEELVTEPEPKIVEVPGQNKQQTIQRNTIQSGGQKTESDDIYLTPLVRSLARSRGISVTELRQLKGSGLNGRITKDDLNAYILSGRPFKSEMIGNMNLSETDSVQQEQASEATEYTPEPGEEVVEMDRTRRLIAEHMVRSKRTSPHVTSMVEIDVTQLVKWREDNKEQFLEKYGIKLTYTPVIVEACVKALKEFPDINISVVGNNIIKKHYFNIGVATALPDGNLIVPVIKDADKANLVNIARQLADLAGRAREGKLLPTEIRGGTFTITNMGQYENVSGTPIINQPEVAILAVGAIKKKPATVKIGNELTIGIRDILILSLTYDHRVVDGALGGSFVRAIGNYLEKELPSF